MKCNLSAIKQFYLRITLIKKVRVEKFFRSNEIVRCKIFNFEVFPVRSTTKRLVSRGDRCVIEVREKKRGKTSKI